MAKSDTIIDGEGYCTVTALAKRGKATYRHYDDFDLMIEELGEKAVRIAVNENTRTHAINEVNRVTTEPKASTKLRKELKDVDADVLAFAEKETAALIERIQKRKAKAAEAEALDKK